MSRTFIAALSATVLSWGALTSCHVVWDGSWPIWIDNWDPAIVDADAGCFYDPALREDVWWFEAEVIDWDGIGDVESVDVWVYDDWRGGRLVDSFALYPVGDPYYWYAEVLERHTLLDCYYPGYSVDFIVWDFYDGYAIRTVWPDTY